MDVVAAVENFFKNVSFSQFSGPPLDPVLARSAPILSLSEADTFLSEPRYSPSLPPNVSLDDRFKYAEVEAKWTIARMDLHVFEAGMRATERTTRCMWFEGAEAPKEIEYEGKILKCSSEPGNQRRLDIFANRRYIGEAYPLTGIIEGKVETVGWLAMLNSPAT